MATRRFAKRRTAASPMPAVMLDDPKRSGPGRVEQLQLDGPDITHEAPVRFRAGHQLAFNQRPAGEYHGRPVGKTSRDRQGGKRDNRNEDDYPDCQQAVSNDGLSVDVHGAPAPSTFL